MVFWRLKCHACGTRSEHSRGSSITQFQCSNCETWNFFDSHGDYIDPPVSFVQEQAEQQRSRQLLTANPTSQQSIFCHTCLRNQQLYNELLSNYLPDENDPQYARFEQGLSQYRRQLDERYPQICKDCAPKAQSMIHEADYYSMTNNASRLMEHSRGGRRSVSPTPLTSRDTGTKIATRAVLTLVGLTVLLSALYQTLWHAFAIVEIQQDFLDGRVWHHSQSSTPLDSGAPVKASQCLEEISRLHFSYSCCNLADSLIPRSMLISLCLLWYNHGLKRLYSPNIRIASITGWREHLAITSFTLLVRLLSYSMHKAVQGGQLLGLTFQQQRAVHMVAIIFIIAGHYIARSSIKTEKWRVKGSIMPRPEDRDILGQFAGPPADRHLPLASQTKPAVLLSKQNVTPFPIQNLIARRTDRNIATKQVALPPSPPHSHFDDPMDIEPVAPAQSINRAKSTNFGLPADWHTVRTNLFSIEDEMRAKQERGRRTIDDDKHMYFKPSQPTPFCGRLPQAPMSQERKLRNPISQVPQFKEIPMTQRQDFLQQMRTGIEKGKGFHTRERSVDSDWSERTTDAASRTRGQLQLAESDWHLPTDLNATTGLEDQFGGILNINDRTIPGQSQPGTAHKHALSPHQWYVASAVAVPVILLMFVLDIAGSRRGICMYFVQRLEEMGY